MIANRLLPLESTAVVESDNDGRDLQQRVGLAVEATRFHVDDHGQETAEALRHHHRHSDSLPRMSSSSSRLNV